MSLLDLTGKRGLVVGIANANSIAYGCAKAFHAAGAELAIIYLNAKAEPSVRPLAQKLASPLLVAMDVSCHSFIRMANTDILLVPDLEASNMLVKQLGYLAGAQGAGIVLGARIPIILTSRADTVLARMASCAVALIAARRRERAAL